MAKFNGRFNERGGFCRLMVVCWNFFREREKFAFWLCHAMAKFDDWWEGVWWQFFVCQICNSSVKNLCFDDVIQWRN